MARPKCNIIIKIVYIIKKTLVADPDSILSTVLHLLRVLNRVKMTLVKKMCLTVKESIMKKAANLPYIRGGGVNLRGTLCTFINLIINFASHHRPEDAYC